MANGIYTTLTDVTGASGVDRYACEQFHQATCRAWAMYFIHAEDVSGHYMGKVLRQKKNLTSCRRKRTDFYEACISFAPNGAAEKKMGTKGQMIQHRPEPASLTPAPTGG